MKEHENPYWLVSGMRKGEYFDKQHPDRKSARAHYKELKNDPATTVAHVGIENHPKEKEINKRAARYERNKEGFKS